MRAKLIVQYRMNRQRPYHPIFQLKPRDYHRIPDHCYQIQYDAHNCVIDLGRSKVTGHVPQTVSDTGLSISKQIVHRYHTDQFAGGRFVIYADHTAELTTYGSGIPIVGSLIGTIVDLEP